MAKVFISYRRSDSDSVSGRIYDRLVGQFGKENIFKDVYDIPPGVRFSEYIKDSLRQCMVELVIIGSEWLAAKTDKGRRRLDDPEDWVRQEIEMGFAIGLTVIPVLVEGASLPKKRESLPESLRRLNDIQATVVRNDPDFGRDMDRLIVAVERGVAAGNPWQVVESPTSKGLSCVVMVSATEGWAVGGDGTILHYTGGRWQEAKSPTSKNLCSVAMVSAVEGWAVGAEGTILHYTGDRWQEANCPASNDLLSIAMVSATEGWAVGLNMSSLELSDVLSVGYFGHGAILHYTGDQWHATKRPFASSWLYEVAMVSATEGWAVGRTGGIVHYTGGQWHSKKSPSSMWLYSVAMVSAVEGWAVGDDGIILHFTEDQWQNVTTPTFKTLCSVAMVSAVEGWAVGDEGTIVHYREGQWQNVASPTSNHLRSVAMVSAVEGWAVGAERTILHYSRGA